MKCAGMGAAKNSKNAHVQDEKLLCAECVCVPKFAAHKYSVKNFQPAKIMIFKLASLYMSQQFSILTQKPRSRFQEGLLFLWPKR